MKKALLLVLTILLLSSVSVFANGDQEAGGETVYLDFNDWNPEGIPSVELWKDVVAQINEKSGGTIQVTNYLSGSLLKFPETFKGVSSGMADISLYLMGGAPGVHELTEIFDLPFLGFKDYAQAMDVYYELLEEFPEIQEENSKKGVKILSIRPMPPYWISSVKKPVRVPSDMQGQKAIATGYYGMIASEADGVAMQTGPGDWYSSLQKGVVEHIITHWAAIGGFQLNEVTKYHTQFGAGGLGNSGLCVLVNLDTWNSLSPEHQQIIEDAYKWYQVEVAKNDLNQVKNDKAAAASAGNEFIELSDAELQQWYEEVGTPIHNKWVEDMDAVGKGDAARAMLEYVKNRISE